MLDFYKKALLIFTGLLLVSGLLAYICFDRTFLHLSLVPVPEKDYVWIAVPETDDYQGGTSTVVLHDQQYSLDFELKTTDVAEYPFAALGLVFSDDNGEAALVDLSRYTSLSFNAKCSMANVLTFAASTVEKGITQTDDFLTYRSPTTFFSCDENWMPVELDLTRMETPQWWLDRFQLKLSMKDYRLDQVAKLVFGSTHQSPLNESVRIQIHQLQLLGRDWRFMYLLAGLMVVMWGGFGVWFFRAHTRALVNDLRSKIQKDRPLVAYQALSVEPQHDRDKDAILRFMATEYANPDLNLDTMIQRIGVSRTKINDILKEELGFTFTGYLNKLRLTEAARLLADKPEASIAEIAYSVGYKNVSYFNKLFKEDYGCTPKVFRSIYDPDSGDSD
jgi:AraC-like DNA-binding protein